MPATEPRIADYVQRVGRKLLATEGPAMAPVTENGRAPHIAARVGTIYWRWERGVDGFIRQHEAAVQRFLEMVPGLITWGFILLPLLLARPAPVIPIVIALAFQVYWFCRGLSMLVYGSVGCLRIHVHPRIDWRARYEAERAAGKRVLPWERIHHLVIIPNYQEPIAKLRLTLESLAAQHEMAPRIWAVLAMEGREEGAAAKAEALQREFAGRLAVYYTIHPDGLPGEKAGKAPNQSWAARWARKRLVDDRGYKVRHIVLTTCDADSVFHPDYFLCLTSKFAADPERYLRVWQAPLLFHNNIRQVPTFVSFMTAMGSIAQLAGLCDPQSRPFPLSTYSLSLALADGVGYWDGDAIAEDWHMFLKCFFRRWGRVSVEPIYLPVSADAALARGLWRTALNRYEQLKRHAWGVSDVAYAVRMYFHHAEIPAAVKLPRLWALAREHLIWSTSWPAITFGILLPSLLNPSFAGSQMGVALARLTGAIGMVAGVLSPSLVLLDCLLRPKQPGRHWWQGLWSAIQWPLMPVYTLLFGTLPAIDAQTRLMLGQDISFRVTEKV